MTTLDDAMREIDEIASKAYYQDTGRPEPDAEMARLVKTAQVYAMLADVFQAAHQLMNEYNIPGANQMILIRSWIMFYSALGLKFPWAVDLSERIVNDPALTNDDVILPVVAEEVIRQFSERGTDPKDHA